MGIFNGGSKSVFVLNDVNLSIPPEAISVQKEDLTYQWRTLRSKIATKIPSGHGQMAIRCTIPFTHDLFMDMHRITTQFRHSPFCYIENKYLRQSIVPDWSPTQNMAFTMTSLQLAPMQGASDAWVMELDLQWFNYLPFIPNYLFREEWQTEWVDAQWTGTGDAFKYSIGWEFDPITGTRTSSPSITAKSYDHFAAGTNRTLPWSSVHQEYSSKKNRTIYDMEILHEGQIFDLLPLPGNMEPSPFVPTPSDSRIYTRYLNLLQRDALLENFDIHVENDLEPYGLRDLFFATKNIEGRPTTRGLHITESRIGAGDGVPAAVMSDWIGKMLRHHKHVTFAYDLFKDIRLPEKLTAKVDKENKALIKTLLDKHRVIGHDQNVTLLNHADGSRTSVPVRNGYTFANGKHVPIRRSVDEFLDAVVPGGRVGARSGGTLKKLYGENKSARMHSGTDISVRDPLGGAHVNLDVYAVEDGYVQFVSRGDPFKLSHWKKLDVSSSEPNKEAVSEGSAAYLDLLESLSAAGVDPNTGRGSRSTVGNGSFVISVSDANVFYFQDLNDGGFYVIMNHFEQGPASTPSVSKYMHLTEISVKKGDWIKKGERIGKSGGVGPYDPAYLKYAFQVATATDALSYSSAIGDNKAYELGDIPASVATLTSYLGQGPQMGGAVDGIDPWALNPHLHFEYWEPIVFNPDPKQTVFFPSSNAAEEGEVKVKPVWSNQDSHIRVDPVWSYEASQTKSNRFIDVADVQKSTIDQLTEATEAEVKNGTIDLDEREALLILFRALRAEGWYYYDDLPEIVNIWYKRPVHSVYTSKAPGTDLFNDILNSKGAGDPVRGSFLHDDIVLTSASGGLRHIVANLPILGHEFPTQQHLGSIEPYYNLEFAVLDDSGGLQGIGFNAEMIEGMRSKLQKNARDFRPIPDGWCVMTDTFITRFLGTTKVYDYQAPDPDNDTGEILRKRTVIARTNSNTVPGNPGLSVLNLELEETNPYQTQKLVSTAPKTEEINAARSKILNALLNFDVNESIGAEIVPIIIAQMAGGRGSLSGVVTAPVQGAIQLADTLGFDPGFGNPNQIADGGVFAVSDFNGAIQTLLSKYDVPFGVETTKIPGTGGGVYYQTLKVKASDLEKIAGPAFVTATQTLGQSGVMLKIDLQEIYRKYPELKGIDFGRLAQDYELLISMMTTSEMLLAENDLGGLHPAYISQELYNLPIQNRMWQSFQYFFNSIIQRLAEEDNRNCLTTRENYWSSPESPSPGAKMVMNRQVETWVSGNWFARALLESVDAEGDVVYAAGSSALSSEVGFSSLDVEANDKVRRNLVSMYRRGFPIALQAGVFVEDTFQGLIGQFVDANVPAAIHLSTQIKQYLDSVNLIGGGTRTGVGKILRPGAGLTKKDGAWGVEETVLTSYDGSILAEMAAAVPDQTTKFYSSLLKKHLFFQGDAAQAKLDSISNTFEAFDAGDEIEISGPIGGPAVYPVELKAEQEKVRYLKQILSRLADDLRTNIGLLELFGLQDLAFLDSGEGFRGIECYPDLVLPFHPYYEDLYQTSPDFYMWNPYEDAGMFSKAIQEDVLRNADAVIENCYKSIKRFQGEGEKYNAGTDPIISEPNADDLAGVRIRYAAEGSDGEQNITRSADSNFDVGPMGSPFYPSKESTEAETKFYNSAFWKNTHGDSVTNLMPPSTETVFGKGYQLKLGTTDGMLQYPLRASDEDYKALWKELDKTENMFGSRAGYLGEELTKDNVGEMADRLSDTAIASLDQYAHGFDPDFLKKLARDSSKDMISQKMTMRRAYPTFKLMFVEEDEFESRFLNFDDFYSYNSVVEFTVVQSKESAADLAVITVQNVAGTLDGTARGEITDLDYFSPKQGRLIEKNNPGTTALAGDPTTQGTAADQPFGALVLRPGLNVQLRAGYSNDPNSLEVLLSGRVVDVMWNQTGDLAEITVQSFGVELEQNLKGTARNSDSYEQFYSTHQLLGTMMLSPELQHFGRWEFGQMFQAGEGKDHRLDFVDYSREGSLGRFKSTNAITRWMLNHPFLVTGASLGVALAGSFIPVGKATRFIPGAKRVLTGAARLEASAAKSAVSTLMKTGAEGTDDALKMAARQKAVAQTVAKIAAGNTADLARYTGGASTGRFLRRDTYKAVLKAIDAGDAAAAETALLAFDKAIANRLVAGRWLGVANFAPKSMQWGKSFAWGTGKSLLTTGLGGGLGIGISGIVAASIVDSIGASELIYNHTLGKLKQFFTRVNVGMFLSPQDDNLFPPSPKDYMLLKRNDFFSLVMEGHPIEAGKGMAVGVGRNLMTWVTGSRQIGDMTLRLFYPDMILEKRVEPQQCVYTPISTSIWRIFQEMSLRHPGWAYAARPYGRDFRYTMFFGVPSQRYWSKPAPNRFIHRMNQLNKALTGDRQIDEKEYIALYGETLENGVPLEHAKRLIQEELDKVDATVKSVTDGMFASPREEQKMFNPADHFGTASVSTYNEYVIPDVNEYADKARVDAVLEKSLTSRALKEYLRGLELRFVPFRRYHMFTSNRDIIWNGIMGSESNVYNAVDVAYFPYQAGEEAMAPEGTELLKANSTIPENMIKIKPVIWPNCKGYTMALRYGMGELIQEMGKMYRGELLLVGNARIRPWDLGIVVDTYNDMVGPIEVHQVVHSFSHSTGFVTEIKPGAVVLGNEISTWPILEAMKTFSMAVKDAERNVAGVGSAATNAGFYSGIAQFFSTWGSKDFNEQMQAKYEGEFPEGAKLDDIFGKSGAPSLPVLDELAANTNQATDVVGGIASGVLDSKPATAVFDYQANAAYYAGLFALGPISYLPGNNGLTLGKELAIFASESARSSQMTLKNVTMAARDIMDPPSLAWLIGGPIILARCMREDAIMILPIMKSGTPIVSGLSYHDPSMIWNNFKGELENWVTDAITGTRDFIGLYGKYSTTIWRKLSNDVGPAGLSYEPDMTGGG